MARGTMPARSFWLMKISDTAGSVVTLRGYSTCQAMGCVPDRLLKLAISKFICTTSLNKLLLLEKEQRRMALSGPRSVEGPFSPPPPQLYLESKAQANSFGGQHLRLREAESWDGAAPTGGAGQRLSTGC